MLQADFNLSLAIVRLFPSSDPSSDFMVEYDGEKYKLVSWNMEEEIPSLEELEQAFNQHNLTTEERLVSLEKAMNDLLLL